MGGEPQQKDETQQAKGMRGKVTKKLKKIQKPVFVTGHPNEDRFAIGPSIELQVPLQVHPHGQSHPHPHPTKSR